MIFCDITINLLRASKTGNFKSRAQFYAYFTGMYVVMYYGLVKSEKLVCIARSHEFHFAMLTVRAK